MSELVANVKGPSEWKCNDGKDCWYNVQIVLNGKKQKPFIPQERQFSRYTESVILAAIFLACIILYIITRASVKRQKKMFGTRIELSEWDDEDTESIWEDDNRKEVFLTFDDICYTVGGKTVLSGVTGYVEPGQLLAVMGPSGAGKSSLLDILSRKHKRGVTSGRTMINGSVPDRRQFKQMTGFVDQDDTLMGTLTVRETLMYAAMLRLPRKMPMIMKQKKVEEVMQELGIGAIADSVIGAPGQRGISGGEKRRVSIGKELVTNPSLLFLDEPTSGLDAYNASMVMECLQRLTKQGKRTVVVTIHQLTIENIETRSNIFKMFDSLMLLAGGQLVYFGPANTTSQYFHDIGFPVPTDYNVADYLIDLTMKKPEEINPSTGSDDQGSPDNEQSLEVSDGSEDASTRLISDTLRTMSSHEVVGEFDLLSDANHAHQLFQAYKTSVLYQEVQARLRQMTTDHLAYSVRVDLPGNHYGPLSMLQFFHELVEVDLSGVQNRLGVLFFMCALLGFASTSALDMFSKERVLFMRERENGYYSPVSYFVAKILFDILPLRVLPPLVMGSVSYYMIGLNPAISVFGKFLLVLILFNLSAAGLCLCFATAFKSVSAANLLANLDTLKKVILMQPRPYPGIFKLAQVS
ncbi:hypothetical protein EC973_005047 [Apophysomyces ossiformis]|uniref:ABC transporter domain-containing protein n=1 Tax=Apophysomyces ossiformis TaxID=679940 RepID=A0A8H7BZG8_9FUNG|nr:hypothetical protein EC973_005047 [Apophysomyces ossiformis]